jgi:hypothetical protein
MSLWGTMENPIVSTTTLLGGNAWLAPSINLYCHQIIINIGVE